MTASLPAAAYRSAVQRLTGRVLEVAGAVHLMAGLERDRDELPEDEYRRAVIDLINRTAQLVHELNATPGVRARIDVEYIDPAHVRHPPNWPEREKEQ